ncbi:MAG: ABC transporter permease subunit [Planctomycetaceae bacterium]|nr:ABC transporter permease subunit [Planctomycetaceae bacterium]
MSEAKAFTGRARRRGTTRWVWFVDRFAKWGIIVGGIATIAVVSTVAVFLAYVALPLFFDADVVASPTQATSWPSAPVAVGMDDQQQIGWALLADGRLQAFRIEGGGGAIAETRPLGDSRPTAFSKFAGTTEFLVGYADGRLQRGKIRTVRSVVEADRLPQPIRSLPVGDAAIGDSALIRHVAEGEFQRLEAVADVEPPIDAAAPSAIVLVDQSVRPSGPIFATLSADDKLRIHALRSQINRRTRQTTTTLNSTELAYTPTARGAPQHLVISGAGDNVFLVWNDGFLQRYDIAAPQSGPIEEVDLVPEDGAQISALSAMIGKATLVVGDSLGRVRGWFRVKPEGLATGDGSRLVAAHDLEVGSAAVSTLAPSTGSRMLGVGYADGRVRLFNMTNENLLADCEPTDAAAIGVVAVAPRDDGLLAGTANRTEHWRMRPSRLGGTWHPDISMAGLFAPIWYEGEAEPKYVWQTSSGSDSYEPKFSFWQLIFGTAKATFYSLLFGVPIAMLAAIYTSEFLSPRWKTVIKPTVELMAGLPSVVLGFIAALVLAPFIEEFIGVLLTAVFAVPACVVLGSHLWQLLPRGTRLAWDRYRFAFIVVALLVGPFAAWQVAGPVERLLFDGDVKAWLSGHGPAPGGWAFLLFPLAAAATAYLFINYLTPWWEYRARGSANEFANNLKSVGILVAGFIAAGALAWLVGLALTAVGLDPRGSLVGGYEQRNTLIVGFAMGFAIVPIIFTIAEDALSTVPSHLRSASLGAGATKWQTAIRIVVPTAMSGLFSAVMVGMGRAVGETMIVLMAAGNTPIMDVNLFNGFRSLSANIAVELPEAVQNSSHYRVLFLSALVLFLLTFILNTAAELVRQRFRRRAYQL